ncbi:MAG: DUF4910 domain-containing protein [Lachnospiraceae bacterium]|nr:DUF4910 domain-containing protein [Lachnospiraceae bacterium]
MAENGFAEGRKMYDLAAEMFPWCRSITGEGIRKTLRRIQQEIPEMTIHEVPTGTKVFDWNVPKEWEINEAWVEDEDGNRVIDFADCNLHILGYSIPVDKVVSLDELQEHLYSSPEQPDYIPYVTSYYKERWGFCMADSKRKQLKSGNYHVHIDSRLFDGSLTYGEVLIPGETEDEVFFSTYCCHPSMANNELSGPVVVTEVVNYIKSFKNRRLSYRIVFIPETIGSITYMSKNLPEMKKHIIAGFNISCVGDDREYGFMPSKEGDTLADRVAINILGSEHPEYRTYTFHDRGSDEREYCSVGADLPVVLLTRSKYNEYPEYHTSADDMSLISPKGLQGTYDLITDIIKTLEFNRYYRINTIGEPQLGKRGLYPDLSRKDAYTDAFWAMKDVLAYSDGKRDLIGLSDKIGAPVKTIMPIIEKMIKAGLMDVSNEPVR